MAVVAVEARGEVPVAAAPLAPLIAALPPGAPVTVMIHGFRFAPGLGRSDPHATLFAPVPAFPDARIVSWPRRLGLLRAGAGLAVGLGWQAAGTLWQAHAEAARAGRALARLIAALRDAGAGPVGVIGHSLGARVALQAMTHLAPGDIGRAVLLAAAEFRGPAAAALASPCGRAAEVLNVTSGENALFDLLFERLLGGPLAARGPALGAGLAAANAVTLRIDADDHREALRRLGYPVAPPSRRVCHWSSYLRPGLFPLYRAFLHRPQETPLARLRAALPAPARRPRQQRPGALPPAGVPAAS